MAGFDAIDRVRDLVERYDVDSMRVKVTIGVPHPEKVDKAQVLAVLPHGTGTVEVVEGGLEIPTEDGSGVTLLAQAAAEVFLDLPEAAAA